MGKLENEYTNLPDPFGPTTSNFTLSFSVQHRTPAIGDPEDPDELYAVLTEAVDAIVAVRTSTPPEPAPARRSLDVYAPTARQQITLSFACAPEQFDRWRPEFRRWLDTVTFARVARAQPSLGERLRTPLIVGGIVGVILVVLYRHTHARR